MTSQSFPVSCFRFCGFVPHRKWNFTFLVHQNTGKKNRYRIIIYSILISTLQTFYQAKEKNSVIYTLRLGQINIWPFRTAMDKTMPEDFKKKYSSTRVIIDCTEVRCQMPSSLQLNGELFSNYKHHTTLKSLIGISPGGAITFISQLYTQSISD